MGKGVKFGLKISLHKKARVALAVASKDWLSEIFIYEVKMPVLTAHWLNNITKNEIIQKKEIYGDDAGETHDIW